MDSPGATAIHRANAFVSSTLPRSRPTDHHSKPSVIPQRATPIIPFQRANNAYWTLQHRKQPTGGGGGGTSVQLPPAPRDDLHLLNGSTTSATPNVEDLYSTPNKLLKTRRITAGTSAADQLRPTAHGFANYFSPIPKTTAADMNASADASQRISPIDPRNTASFKTSTPTKPTTATPTPPPLVSLADELRQKLHIKEAGSNVSSPISSGRSTPRLEPQHSHNGRASDADLSQFCSDRLGAPKTSLMDFKKLLLTKAGKVVPVAKPSAVEQLRLAKVAAANAAAAAAASPSPPVNSSLNIIDMSGSPKTFANRRMIRQGNFGSPSKNHQQASSSSHSAAPPSIGKHMSPRTAWKFANYRTDVMSTAIPEANSEEDASSSPNSSNSNKQHMSGTVPKALSIGGLIRSTSVEPIQQSATATNAPMSPPSISDSIIADNINLKNNIFLQAEENNFMRGEIGTKSLSRAQLQQARSHFLASAANAPPGSPQQPMRSAQFKNGHYTGISPTRKPVVTTTAGSAAATMMFRANTESILDTSVEGTPAPSLETAL